MQSKRGGRIQVNMLQYYELVERVEKLEAQNVQEDVKQEEPEEITQEESGEDSTILEVLTKPQVMALLDEKGTKYNPRDKKDVLIELLNSEVE